MRRNKKTLIAAIAVGALVLAGSAAFTDQLTTTGVGTNQGGNYVGYGAVDVTNGTLDSISYTGLTATDPPEVTQVTLVFAGDTASQSAYVGFYTGATAPGTDVGSVECTNPPTVTGAGDDATTTYVCTTTSLEVTADQVQSTDVALANGSAG